MEKQAHAATAASLKQTQQKNVREVRRLELKVIDAFGPNQKCHSQQDEHSAILRDLCIFAKR